MYLYPKTKQKAEMIIDWGDGTSQIIADWNPNSSLYIGSKLGVETNSYACQQRSNVFKVSPSNGHSGLIGHEYRSTVIENFLRTL